MVLVPPRLTISRMHHVITDGMKTQVGVEVPSYGIIFHPQFPENPSTGSSAEMRHSRRQHGDVLSLPLYEQKGNVGSAVRN